MNDRVQEIAKHVRQHVVAENVESTGSQDEKRNHCTAQSKDSQTVVSKLYMEGADEGDILQYQWMRIHVL